MPKTGGGGLTPVDPENLILYFTDSINDSHTAINIFGNWVFTILPTKTQYEDGVIRLAYLPHWMEPISHLLGTELYTEVPSPSNDVVLRIVELISENINLINDCSTKELSNISENLSIIARQIENSENQCDYMSSLMDLINEVSLQCELSASASPMQTFSLEVLEENEISS